ncbi:hypothetical protein GCM10019016_098110 [Streptomyces prasinosporus]|uniref:Uncharacterized protein n=1 Tax=Streptomyces prasinosporus TaxID=68256 RepID=A0ABP6U4T4_9ACTN|nr:hypothetical protein GCM10010332_62440 [Streptomyces albogriseolus]
MIIVAPVVTSATKSPPGPRADPTVAPSRPPGWACAALIGVEIPVQLPAQGESGAEVCFAGEVLQQDVGAGVIAFTDGCHDLLDHLT